ncbi:hypothetical protein BCV69DRAFT_283887 [Microstroma glucosiphilum]|uniref:Uncharacterized protein n=1 Tax=Pseudomicrostroma glucosiphilum TaxID=1684307 RepID=A0A316U9V1_9BASI|nr:hypothetical protein BCV69DRAFT_283887 [Pseudomicrostroma glucosiphilum]PWN19785.1 hypothetical protein BCV69DRAFT_283887 [Pseudomicrostroma glucosiphilum]
MNQAAVASPRSARNGYAIPSPESRREGSSPPSTASSNSILKKTCSSHGSQEGREGSSCGKKMGKMVRITTSTPNMSTSRPRRSSSPKSPSGHTGARSMQRSARHAQDYRTSNAFDRQRQQEEMCRRRRIAEDLVRKEIKAQREAERVLQREMETRHDQVLEECRRAQETHLRRIEEQDKLLKEYEALRLAPTGHVEPSRGKSKERRLERHLVAQGDERSASDSLREPHGFSASIQQEAPSDTSAEPSLPHDSVRGDIVSSPASFHSPGSYRQASLDSRSPFSISRGTSVTRQDNSHEGSQGRVAPSRSRSPPSTTPSLSRSARLHRSSSRLLRAIFRQQEQQQQQKAEVEGEQRKRLDVKPRDSSTGSQRTDRGRRPSLRVTTNLTTLGKCEVKAQSAEGRKDQSFCSKGSKIDHEHNNAGELAASSAPSLPRTHTRARSTGRGGAGQGRAGGGLLGNSACPCEDGFKCTNRAICWATRKLRGRGPPS